jgi:hypothetical protein
MWHGFDMYGLIYILISIPNHKKSWPLIYLHVREHGMFVGVAWGPG